MTRNRSTNLNLGPRKKFKSSTLGTNIGALNCQDNLILASRMSRTLAISLLFWLDKILLPQISQKDLKWSDISLHRNCTSLKSRFYNIVAFGKTMLWCLQRKPLWVLYTGIAMQWTRQLIDFLLRRKKTLNFSRLRNQYSGRLYLKPDFLLKRIESNLELCLRWSNRKEIVTARIVQWH